MTAVGVNSSFEFLWVDKKQYLRPTRLPARTYIDTLFDWLKEQLEDESLFPVEECGSPPAS